MTIFRTVPDADLQSFVEILLTPGRLLPVNVDALSREDIYNVYRDADEHLLLVRAISDLKFSDAERAEGMAARKQLYQVSRKLRRAALRLLPEGSRTLAQSEADKYRKSIAEGFPAMVDTGCVLVRLSDPQLTERQREINVACYRESLSAI
jgi:hypothetical protein